MNGRGLRAARGPLEGTSTTTKRRALPLDASARGRYCRYVDGLSG